jgi:small subunit ribosomal protein S5
MAILRKKLDSGQYNLKDQVVAINRVTKVVKGGKNMSFAALVVVGDPGAGVVGYGSGKAREVPQAIRKGIEAAKKNLVRVNLTDTTIPHQVLGRFGSGQVLLKPAPAGTGVIAGGAVRAVMTSAGVQNVLTKSLGTANPHNVIKATFDALVQLRDKNEVAACGRRNRPTATRSASGAVWAPERAKPPDVDTRDRDRGRAPVSCAVLKVARCRCTGVCRSAASPTSSVPNTPF